MNLKLLAVLILGTLAVIWYANQGAPPSVPAIDDPAATESDNGRPRETKTDGSTAPGADKSTSGEVDGAADQARQENREAVPTKKLGPITGRVVDEAGNPVAGATIAANSGSGLLDFSDLASLGTGRDLNQVVKMLRDRRGETTEAMTRGDGRFELVASAGVEKLAIVIKARGFQLERTESKKPGTDGIDLGDLVVKRGGVISGRVLDSYDQPVEGALVRRTTKMASAFDMLRAPGTGELMELDSLQLGASLGPFGPGPAVRTNTRGEFEMPHAIPGEFALRVTHKEHPAHLLADQEVKVGQVIGDLVIVLARSASIAGVVTGIPEGTSGLTAMARSVNDEKKSAPSIFGLDPMALMGGMGLMLGERTAKVAADGSYTLRGLDAQKRYKVWAVQSGENFQQVKPCTEPRISSAGARNIDLPFAPGFTVTFRVVDAKNGKPLTRLDVTPQFRGGGDGGFAELMSVAMGSTKKSFEDCEDGRVTLFKLRPKAKQRLSLRIAALGYATLTHKVGSLPADGAGSIDLGTLRLQSAPIVRVHVTDAVTGKPVAGADVSLKLAEEERQAMMIRRVSVVKDSNVSGFDFRELGDLSRTAKTDADGWCSINALPGKPVTIIVESDDHATSKSRPVNVPAAGESSHEIKLLCGGGVDVLVLDSRGEPVDSMVVEHRHTEDLSNQRTSDEHGIARFTHLQPGPHRFRLKKKRGMFSRIRVEVANAGQVGEKPALGWHDIDVRDTVTQRLTLTKHAVGRLHGIVRENGQPLRGARVKFLEGTEDTDGASGSTAALEAMTERIEGMMSGAGRPKGKTDGSGKYALDDLSIGDHRVRVTYGKRAMPAIVKVHIREGDNEFNIELVMTVLIGRVLDPDGTPVDGARISVVTAGERAEVSQAMDMASEMFGALGAGGGGGIKTDDNGYFELRGMRANQRIQVRVKASGFATAVSGKVTLTAGETRRGLEIRLSAAGKVRVRFKGKAPMFAAVQAKYQGPEENVDPVRVMMSQGRATLTGLRPGKWKIMISAMGGAGGEKKTEKMVEVKAGETTRVTFDQ